MAVQYRCENASRRELLVANGTINGIDFVEVVDGELDAADPGRQKLLIVVGFLDLPDVDATWFEVTGGVRVVDPAVAWALRLDKVDPASLPDLSPGEVVFLSNLKTSTTADERVVVLHFAEPGDYSPYVVKIVDPATGGTIIGFDPIYSRVTFTFKADCPSPFDCRTDEPCAVEADDAPRIDHLARDYASFRTLMLDRMAALVPEWVERSPADLGVAVVEVLAYAADHLAYYQDAVATEAYLGTARKRVSMRRHARLRDYPMHEGCNARAWVHFDVTGTLTLPPGTVLCTRIPGRPTAVDPAELAELVDRYGPTLFETMHLATLVPARNEIRIHTWGDSTCCLPAGATAATLVGDVAVLGLAPGDVLVFEEVRSPDSGLVAEADREHRHAVRLVSVTQSEDPLAADPKVVDVEWHEDDALPFALRVSDADDGTGPVPPVVVRANVVLCDHGWSSSGESLLPAAVTSGRYRPVLQRTGLTHAEPYEHAGHAGISATATLAQELGEAIPVLELSDGVDPWSPVRDLLGSDGNAREFVVEMEDDGVAHLRFGDGEHGRKPVAGTAFAADYRVGNGKAGEVGPEALVHVVTAAAGSVSAVRNPMGATGAVDPEPIEDVRRFAPQAMGTNARAVTPEDHVAIVETHPQVSKAAATLRWTGSWYTMFVTVDRKGGLDVDAAFEEEIEAFLEPYRMMGRDVEVDGPRFVPLDIALTVCTEPGHAVGDVLTALTRRFSARDHADGTRGFFHPDELTFGQPVYLSAVIAAAMAVPGVRFVHTRKSAGVTMRFQRWGRAADGEIEAGEISLGRLEIARCASDPNTPEHGRITFDVRSEA